MAFEYTSIENQRAAVSDDSNSGIRNSITNCEIKFYEVDKSGSPKSEVRSPEVGTLEHGTAKKKLKNLELIMLTTNQIASARKNAKQNMANMLETAQKTQSISL